MAIDESSRHAMYNRLQEVLGDEHAAVLMEHLPPVGWADVATKRDLDMGLEALENRLLATFRKEMNEQTKTMVQWSMASTLTVGALAFAAAHLV